MQSYNTNSPRIPVTNKGIDTKVSAPAGKQGKGLGVAAANPKVDAGAYKGSVKGFSGGLINPRIKA